MFLKIVSGGQTGVDRAALDFALAEGIDYGGWCPRGRRAEDGKIATTYNLQETPERSYRQRTQWNVRDADGTLILINRELKGGTLYTLKTARKMDKPVLVVSFAEGADQSAVDEWLERNNVRILNVAGPRASSEPAIYALSLAFLRKLYMSR